MLLTNCTSNTMLSPLFLTALSLLGVFPPFGLVPVLLQLLWFFPVRTQMLLLECEKQYHPMDPHPTNLGHFGHYSFLSRVAQVEHLGKCTPSWNRSQLYYFHQSSGSKPGTLIPTVTTRLFKAKIDEFFLIVQFSGFFHHIILQIYHCILFINNAQST
jgi:hypothetical protein